MSTVSITKNSIDSLVGELNETLKESLRVINVNNNEKNKQTTTYSEVQTTNTKYRLESFKELDSIPTEVFKHYFLNDEFKDSAISKTIEWNNLVASPEEILADYHMMDKNPLISKWLATNFQLRSIEGHAHEGHVFFADKQKYPNTQLSDVFSNEVLKHVKNKSKKIIFSDGSKDLPRPVALKQSQRAINNSARFALKLITKDPRMKKILPKNFFGIKFPFDIPVNNSAFSKGIFFGANFDNYSDVREPMEEIFNITAGGGESYLGNIPLIKKLGINLNEFAKGNYENPLLQVLFDYDSDNNTNYLIDVLTKVGIIKETEPINHKVSSWDEILEQARPVDKDEYRQIFVRKKKGLGVSDDVACMNAQFIDYKPFLKDRTYSWYFSLGLGVHSGDLMDTLTKECELYVPGGFDTVAGKFFNYNYVERLKKDSYFRKRKGYRNYKSLTQAINRNKDYMLVSKGEIINLTALSLNPNKNNNGQQSLIYHSSGKNFLHQWTFGSDITSTIEQEMRFVYRKLEEEGIAVHKDSPRRFPGKLYPSEISIGFNRIQFSYLINHMNKYVIPIATETSDRRSLLKIYYSNESPQKINGHVKSKKEKFNNNGFQARRNNSNSRNKKGFRR